jgi:predicted dehydrogenase
LGVYAIDAARWLVGDLESVVGHTLTVIERRPLIDGRHDFDSVLRLTREEALTISDKTGRVENEDECTFLARFESGAHGTFRASRIHDRQRLEAWGPRGALLWQLQGDRLWIRHENQIEYVEVEVPRKAPQPTFVHAFAQDIRNATSHGPTFDDGTRAQAVIDAVLRSAAEAGWVAVPDAG